MCLQSTFVFVMMVNKNINFIKNVGIVYAMGFIILVRLPEESVLTVSNTTI